MTALPFAPIRMLGMVVATLVTVVTLSSCALLPGNGADAHAPAEIVEGVDCAAGADPVMLPPEDVAGLPSPRPAPAAGAVPADFAPVEVVTCDPMALVETEIDGLPWWGVREQRLAGDLAPLLAELDYPSDAPTSGACTADMELRPLVWLVDGTGEAMIARWPLDGCGKSKTDVVDALGTLEAVGGRIVPVAPRGAPAPAEEICLGDPDVIEEDAVIVPPPADSVEVSSGSTALPVPAC